MPSQTTQPANGLLWMWTLRCLLSAAAGVSGYLLYVSLSRSGLPAGCGVGSGCETVLASRWSTVMGLPVSALGMLAYVFMLSATVWIGESSVHRVQRLAWSILVWLAYTVALAAAWFIVVQHFILESICAYCMADHAFGLASAGLIFLRMPRSRAAGEELVAGRHTLLLVATACVLTLIGIQWLAPSRGPQVGRLAPGRFADSGPGANRRITVLPVNLTLVVRDQPTIGSPDAPHVIVFMYDYCCSHCRTAHGNLKECLNRYPGQLSILTLPVPLDADCNPEIHATKPRFVDACELARLAWAVWNVKPGSFEAFDAWLFQQPQPRALAAARSKAESLVGPSELEAALANPDMEAALQRNISAYATSGAASLPLIVSPGMAAVFGSPANPQELYDILETELGLGGSPPRRE